MKPDHHFAISLLSSSLILGAAQVSAQELTPLINSVEPDGVSAQSILGAGRNIMRRPNGPIVGAFAVPNGDGTVLNYSASIDDGLTWNSLELTEIGLENPESGVFPSIDSNKQGAYVAFTEGTMGRIAYIPNALGIGATFQSSGPLTPGSSNVRSSFIAASRSAGHVDVGYGWVDDDTGTIYVGHSDDGETFPVANAIHTDPDILGGVSVATEGDYMLMTYHSRSPEYAPEGLEGDGGAYPVWMQTVDGGETWTEPEPILGRSLNSFPKAEAAAISENGDVQRETVFAAGGASDFSLSTNALAWARVAFGEEIIFVTSSMKPVSLGTPTADWGAGGNHIGVVSFKDFQDPGSEWRHVIANRPLLGRDNAPISSAHLHQYSALPNTPVRSVTYVEQANEGTSEFEERIVIAISTDSGKKYDQFLDFKASDLGLEGLGTRDLSFSVSQCLFADENGDIFVDVVLLGSDASAGLQHAKLPTGINVSGIMEPAIR